MPEGNDLRVSCPRRLQRFSALDPLEKVEAIRRQDPGSRAVKISPCRGSEIQSSKKYRGVSQGNTSGACCRRRRSIVVANILRLAL